MGKKVRITHEKMQPGDIDIHYVYYNNMRPASQKLSLFFMGIVSIVHVPKENGDFERRVFRTNDEYQMNEFRVIGRSRSEYSDFELFDKRLFMKQEIEKQIEMASTCGYGKSFKHLDIGRPEDTCVQCPYLADDMASNNSYIFTFRSQQDSCDNCASIYDKRENGQLE